MFSLGDILVNIKSNTDGLKKGMDDVTAMGENTKSLGEKVQSGLNTAAKGLAVVGAGLTIYAKSATDYTENLLKSSKSLGTQLGVSTTEASRLVAAVGRMGVSAEDASQLFGIFEKKIEASTTASKDNQFANEKLQNAIQQTKLDIAATTQEIQLHGDKTGALALKIKDLNVNLQQQQHQLTVGADAFARLGVTTVDAQGKQRDFNSILGDVADKFKAMPNGVDKTALSMELFGRSGKDMVKILNLGSQGIQDLEKQSDKLGLTLNATTIVSIEKLVTAQKNLKQETDAMKIAVGTATAPILTSFDTVLNNIVRTLMNAPAPIHNFTVGVLAFGGPIASAASGLAAFGANAVQMVEGGLLTKIGGGFTGLISILQGPWAIAIAAAALGIGILVDHFMNHKNITEQLTTATSNLAQANRDLQGAQDAVKSSSLDLQGAQLNLESAQKSYNDAVAQYGPNSLEARQAAYYLAVAHQAVDKAQQGSKDSLQQLHDKEREVAKDQSLINHLKDTAANEDAVANKALNAGAKLDLLNGRKVTVKTTQGVAGNAVIDFVSTFGKRALGGPVKKGQPYITGEAGQELYIPNENGTIIPHDMTTSFVDNLISVSNMLRHFMAGGASAFVAQSNMAAASAGPSYGDFKVYGNVNIDSQADADYLIKKATGKMDRDMQLQKMGGSRTG